MSHPIIGTAQRSTRSFSGSKAPSSRESTQPSRSRCCRSGSRRGSPEPHAAPQLLVRLYPDDVHLDGHDPRLTDSEVSAGQAYWKAVRNGGPADRAWAQLLIDVGPTRAIWVREALTPTNDAGAPVFPAVDTASNPTGLAALARALPDSFIVRARYPGGETRRARKPDPGPPAGRASFRRAVGIPRNRRRPWRRTATTRSSWTRACAGWSISPTRSPSAWPSRSTCPRRPRPSTRCWR